MDRLFGMDFLAQVSPSAWGAVVHWLKANATAWDIVGYVGAVLFFSRFLVQWIASERAGRSVIPASFWYLSLAGTAALLAFGIHMGKLVLILSYAPNAFVYLRNLMLIKGEKDARFAARANG